MTLIEVWFDIAVLRLKEGEELFFQVGNKEEQKIRLKDLTRLKIAYELVDPILASNLIAFAKDAAGELWVGLRRKKFEPLMGRKVCQDGKTRRIYLNDDLDRARRLRFMAADGLSLKEVEEMEGELSKEERKLFPQ